MPTRQLRILPGLLLAGLLLWTVHGIESPFGNRAGDVVSALRETGALTSDATPGDFRLVTQHSPLPIWVEDRDDGDPSAKGAVGQELEDSFTHRPVGTRSRRLNSPAVADKAFRITAVYLLTARLRL
jgi:hypothetical protein